MEIITEDITSKSLVDTIVYGRLKKLKVLLEGGANVNTTAFDNIPIISLAVSSASDTNIDNVEKMVECLLKHGADVNMKDGNGMTPLMYSSMYTICNRNIVDVLLAKEANVSIKDQNGCTALDYAVKFRQLRTAKKLIKHCKIMGITSLFVSTGTAEFMLGPDHHSHSDQTNHSLSHSDSYLDKDNNMSTETASDPCPKRDHDETRLFKRKERYNRRFMSESDQAHLIPSKKKNKSKVTNFLETLANDLEQVEISSCSLPKLEQEETHKLGGQKYWDTFSSRVLNSNMSSESYRKIIRNNKNDQKETFCALESEINRTDEIDTKSCIQNPLGFHDCLPKSVTNSNSDLRVRRNWCRRLNDDISRSRRTSTYSDEPLVTTDENLNII